MLAHARRVVVDAAREAAVLALEAGLHLEDRGVALGEVALARDLPLANAAGAVVEGAAAIGVVMGFVVMLFVELAAI